MIEEGAVEALDGPGETCWTVGHREYICKHQKDPLRSISHIPCHQVPEDLAIQIRETTAFEK